ncbi:aminopyrimidine aminohydrolase [Longimycelium tulufanense]|uniref:Aminopyrimidine aminohydrolase n=1 Tax=Longimycelium tulufanense TaxID=907463 RepID=A0A8J3C7P2_9PSEU|nr:TenA family protein [Longimycelium tulufanense]GGM50593.1 aminopyrimidine aminohydrolase [Longimycelium tulufanense]
MTGFCAQAWQHTARLQQAMLDLRFNTELSDGVLSRERFQFYLVQDARYLVGFGRALAALATRAPEVDDVAFFAGAAREAIVVERELHAGYFERFGLSQRDVEQTETSPTCLAYTSYLLALATTGSVGELAAGLLPCFWVYHHVGSAILARQATRASGAPENPYRAWIDTYADEEFGAAVASCRDAVDRTAAAAGPDERARMLAAFTRATEYEWLFWDSAYRMESWPTKGLR